MSHDENPYQSPSTTNKTPNKARRTWAELETVIVAWCVVAILVWLGLPFLDTVLSLFLPLYLLLFLPCLAGALFLTLRYIWWPSRPADQTTQPPIQSEPVADPWSDDNTNEQDAS